MKKLSIKEIEDGYIIAKPVVNEKDQILLHDGTIIKKNYIDKLEANNISDVYVVTEDEDMDSFSVEAIESESVDRIQNIIEKFVMDEDDEKLNQLVEIASNVVRDVIMNPPVLSCLICVKRKKTDIYSHMLNTASMSVIMAISMGFSEESIKDIACGALLHDVGLCDVGVPYENVEIDRMPAAEKLNYKKHVIHGYESLQDNENFTDTAKKIILEHHERLDGSGYPFHKIGERLSPEIKVVSICDHFDELVNGIGYKRRKVREVIEYFRTSGTFLFDYEMINFLINKIAWFPNGTKVETNENECGIIIRQNKGFPDRPVIKITGQTDGIIYAEPVEKDLTEYLTVFITDTAE